MFFGCVKLLAMTILERKMNGAPVMSQQNRSRNLKRCDLRDLLPHRAFRTVKRIMAVQVDPELR